MEGSHPTDKDYLYHSTIHNTWSDHAPIFLELAVDGHKIPRWFWRLSDNLLKEETCIAEIRQAIKEFVQIHETDITTLPLQWEMLKCVLRGLFIKHGS